MYVESVTLTRRVASVAPERPAPDRPSHALPSEVDELCRRWAAWSHSRRLYAPSPRLKSVLGNLVKIRQTSGAAPSAQLSRELALFHHCVIAAPPDDEGRLVFELVYLHRIRNVAAVCRAIGVSRATWYRRLNDFACHVAAAHRRVMQEAVE